MNEYQTNAYTRKGEFVHCALQLYPGSTPTLQDCIQLEQAWRQWRRGYLTANPGQYLLRDRKLGRIYIVETPVGNIRFDLP